MVASTWGNLTRGLDGEDLAKLTVFRDFCRTIPEVQERIHSSEIAYARNRVFASAYVKSHYLELGIELLREVDDPKPRTRFPTTKTVTMHRYSLRRIEQFDERLRALIQEAADTVGPGARVRRNVVDPGRSR